MSKRFCALGLMAKAPLVGEVKTRLVPPLTAPEAAEVSRPRLWPPYGFRNPDAREPDTEEPVTAEEEAAELEEAPPPPAPAEAEEIRTWEEPMEEEEPSAP